jgi:hypothetical protein
MMMRVKAPRMLARAIALVIFVAMQLRAVDSDFRAGLWEGTIDAAGELKESFYC